MSKRKLEYFYFPEGFCMDQPVYRGGISTALRKILTKDKVPYQYFRGDRKPIHGTYRIYPATASVLSSIFTQLGVEIHTKNL